MKPTVKPLSISADTFKCEVLDSDIPVILDIWADWCAPCRMLSPLLDKLATELDGIVKIVKLDRDENKEFAINELGARSIPRLQVFHNGEQTDEQIGFADYQYLLEWLAKTLSGVGIEYSADQPGEEDFAASVSQAFAELEETLAPASQAYSDAVRPTMEKLDAYKEELTGEGVEGDELAAKLKAKQQEFMPELQPAADEYQKVAKPAEEKFVKAVEAATAAFCQGEASESDNGDKGNEGGLSGKVCDIDDPTCQS